MKFKVTLIFMAMCLFSNTLWANLCASKSAGSAAAPMSRSELFETESNLLARTMLVVKGIRNPKDFSDAAAQSRSDRVNLGHLEWRTKTYFVQKRAAWVEAHPGQTYSPDFQPVSDSFLPYIFRAYGVSSIEGLKNLSGNEKMEYEKDIYRIVEVAGKISLEADKNLAVAKYKPVPSAGEPEVFERFKVKSIAQLADLTGATKEDFDLAGYRLQTATVKNEQGVEESKLVLEQNYNQHPKLLNKAFNLKLNGIHGKYADILLDFIYQKIATGDISMKRSELIELSRKIHNLWMGSETYKVEGPLVRILKLNPKTFSKFSVDEIMNMINSILTNPGRRKQIIVDKKKEIDELSALLQFRVYDQLSNKEKMADDVILLENIRTLLSHLP